MLHFSGWRWRSFILTAVSCFFTAGHWSHVCFSLSVFMFVLVFQQKNVTDNYIVDIFFGKPRTHNFWSCVTLITHIVNCTPYEETAKVFTNRFSDWIGLGSGGNSMRDSFRLLCMLQNLCAIVGRISSQFLRWNALCPLPLSLAQKRLPGGCNPRLCCNPGIILPPGM